MWQGREPPICGVALLDARLALDVTRRAIVEGKRRTEGELGLGTSQFQIGNEIIGKTEELVETVLRAD
jgi:hypothetical protein